MFRSGVASAFLVALVLWKNDHVAQAQSSSPEASGCFTTIQSLQDAMDNTTSLFADGMTEYILCPDTQFDVTSTLTPSTSSRIRCGTTGMSAGNCTIQGGNVQVLVAPSKGLRQYHVIFEGLSFASASVTSNVIVAAQNSNSGSLFEYRDCIFLHQTVALSLSVQAEDDPQTPGQPAPLSPTWLEVIMDGCRFESNTPQALVQQCRGLICVHSSHILLTIRNSVFLHNDYYTYNQLTASPMSTFLVDVVEGGRLELDQNCFVNNSVVGVGIVQLYSDQDVVTVFSNDSNYGRDNYGRGNCSAVHTLVTNECHAFGASVCARLPPPMTIKTEDATNQPATSSTKSMHLGLLVLLVMFAWR